MVQSGWIREVEGRSDQFLLKKSLGNIQGSYACIEQDN